MCVMLVRYVRLKDINGFQSSPYKIHDCFHREKDKHAILVYLDLCKHKTKQQKINQPNEKQTCAPN